MLIGNLLDVTKFQSGKMQFNEEVYDFNELVHEVVDEIQHTTDKHKIKIKVAGNNTAHGDRERTGQVITNLLTNAIKYSPQFDHISNAKYNTIIVSVKAGNDVITFSVQDFGLGIPQEKKEKIFEQFYRVDGESRNTYGGLGLGLYISREIIKRQGGNIWVVSEIGSGSTFYFTLPVNT